MEHNQTITHRDLEKDLKKTIIKSSLGSLVLGIFSAIIVVNTFYINTTRTMDEHTTELTAIKKDALIVRETLNDAKIMQNVSDSEISGIKENVNHIQEQQDKMNDKLDKILMQTK